MRPDIDRLPTAASARWRVEDIEFDRIDHSLIGDEERLFFLVTSASFIEMAADVYTGNLVEHYRGDSEATDWLAQHWQHEEVQHGVALREYARHAWPDFDWDRAYEAFFREYSAACTEGELEVSRALELAARCVVETGTSTYYTMLSEFAEEPVLRALADRIKRDEVAHYRSFRRLFSRYNGAERQGRLRLIRTLIKRFSEAESDDAYYAFKHAYTVRYPDRVFERADFESFVAGINPVFRRHYPYRMAVRMLLQLLDVHALLRRAVEPMLVAAARRLMFR
ncbi:MAG: ferritin-like domain-containing protein [Chromatiales bacterium]|jgi:hypothetical protein